MCRLFNKTDENKATRIEGSFLCAELVELDGWCDLTLLRLRLH